jgi:hypothetical protein
MFAVSDKEEFLNPFGYRHFQITIENNLVKPLS